MNKEKNKNYIIILNKMEQKQKIQGYFNSLRKGMNLINSNMLLKPFSLEAEVQLPDFIKSENKF